MTSWRKTVISFLQPGHEEIKKQFQCQSSKSTCPAFSQPPFLSKSWWCPKPETSSCFSWRFPQTSLHVLYSETHNHQLVFLLIVTNEGAQCPFSPSETTLKRTMCLKMVSASAGMEQLQVHKLQSLKASQQQCSFQVIECPSSASKSNSK